MVVCSQINLKATINAQPAIDKVGFMAAIVDTRPHSMLV